MLGQGGNVSAESYEQIRTMLRVVTVERDNAQAHALAEFMKNPHLAGEEVAKKYAELHAEREKTRIAIAQATRLKKELSDRSLTVVLNQHAFDDIEALKRTISDKDMALEIEEAATIATREHYQSLLQQLSGPPCELQTGYIEKTNFLAEKEARLEAALDCALHVSGISLYQLEGLRERYIPLSARYIRDQVAENNKLKAKLEKAESCGQHGNTIVYLRDKNTELAYTLEKREKHLLKEQTQKQELLIAHAQLQVEHNSLKVSSEKLKAERDNQEKAIASMGEKYQFLKEQTELSMNILKLFEGTCKTDLMGAQYRHSMSRLEQNWNGIERQLKVLDERTDYKAKEELTTTPINSRSPRPKNPETQRSNLKTIAEEAESTDRPAFCTSRHTNSSRNKGPAATNSRGVQIPNIIIGKPAAQLAEEDELETENNEWIPTRGRPAQGTYCCPGYGSDSEDSEEEGESLLQTFEGKTTKKQLILSNENLINYSANTHFTPGPGRPAPGIFCVPNDSSDSEDDEEDENEEESTPCPNENTRFHYPDISKSELILYERTKKPAHRSPSNKGATTSLARRKLPSSANAAPKNVVLLKPPPSVPRSGSQMEIQKNNKLNDSMQATPLPKLKSFAKSAFTSIASKTTIPRLTWNYPSPSQALLWGLFVIMLYEKVYETYLDAYY